MCLYMLLDGRDCGSGGNTLWFVFPLGFVSHLFVMDQYELA